MTKKARKKDLELPMIGKETIALFDKFEKAEAPTDRERVVKIANSIRSVIKRIEDTNHPSNVITFLLLEECISELYYWDIILRSKDEQEEGKQDE